MPYSERHQLITKTGVEVDVIFHETIVHKWTAKKIDAYVETVRTALDTADLL